MIRHKENDINTECNMLLFNDTITLLENSNLSPEILEIYNKIKEQVKENKDQLAGFIGSIAAYSSNAVKFNDELSKALNGYKTNIGSLIKSNNIGLSKCLTKSVPVFGLISDTIDMNEAINTDRKNGTFENTAIAFVKTVTGTYVTILLTPYVLGAGAPLAVAAAGVMVILIAALSAKFIGESLIALKDYTENITEYITTKLLEFEDKLSTPSKLIFNEVLPILLDALSSLPLGMNEMQQKIQNEHPNEMAKAANNLGLNVCPIPNRPLDKIKKLVETASVTPSPLIVDLDGDGVETVSVADGVYFDHDGNGFAERSGWVGQDDGLLVRDLNNNGQIDNGSELFGNNTVLSNGKKAANGFEALKDLDSNSDGIFNASDTAWNEVKVWKDSNQNGLVDNGELITLEQANIKNINLNYQNSTIVDENDNAHKQTGSFTNTSEAIGSINDVWFNADFSDTANRVSVEIPEEIKALPNVRAFGNVHDLHSAMALDESGELKALVEDFIAETSVAARKGILLNLIYHWTGVQNESPNGRDPTRNYGKVIDDTRKLEALEEFMGEEFLGTWCWGGKDPNPHGKAAPYIIRAFDILQEYINNELLAQTHYKPLLENVKLEWNTENSAWNIDVSGAVAKLQEIYNTNALNGALTLTEFGKLIKKQNMDATQEIIAAFKAAGNAESEGLPALLTTFADVFGTVDNDNLTGSDNIDIISGEDGNDTIYAGKGNDTLLGGNGNDSLWGEDGNDTLIGGPGNDYLNGGDGADTYIFEPGFGHDTIDNTDDNASADEPDIVQFGEGITPNMVTISRDGFDLILTVTYTDTEQKDNSVRILSYFDKAGTTSAAVNAITFADGTSWDVEYVYSHYNLVPDALGGKTIVGGDGYDWIVDTGGDDLIIANGGDDKIISGTGNDVIIGGPGNDEISCEAGNKTYVYNLGDGCDLIYASNDKDRILFGEGISFEDLTFSTYNGNGLLITIKNAPNQTIKISGFMWGGNRINDMVFADGSIYHLSDMPLTLIQTDEDETIYSSGNGDTIYGMGGNDKIYGSNADEVFIGGPGDDQLEGGYGNDTYIWNLGDGLDTIKDSNGIGDRIKFGPGITREDLRFVKGAYYSGTLYIYVKNDLTQGVILENNFNDDNIEYVELADGTVISLKEEGLFFNQTDADDAMSGTDYDDVIYGNGGDDTLSGSYGNDIIAGGPGNDKLYGNNGDDTYIYNLGDGFDTIEEQDGNDTIQMGEGITFADLTFERSGDTLNIYVNAEKTQGVSIYNQYNWNGYMVENLKLADGTVIDLSSAENLFPPQNKTA